MAAVSLIAPRPGPVAQTDFALRRDQTITFIAVGLLLIIASSVGLAFTMEAPILFPIAFSATLLFGVGIALRPLFYDWTPYHDTQGFKGRLDRNFIAYNDNAPFLQFATKFQPAELYRNGWITYRTQMHYTDLCQLSNEQEEDIVTANRAKWNDYVRQPQAHTDRACEQCTQVHL